MQQPLVSAFIPSYNHAAYVGEAIDSLLNQSYSNMEIIVVDDGSTDGSHEILKRYAKNSQVTVILNKDNRGQSAVFNQALAIAKGEFISYLPSDDWHLKDKTRLQIDKFLAAPPSVGVVYGKGARYFEDTGETREMNYTLRRGRVIENLLSEGNFVYPATPMFRRSLFDVVKLDESYKAEGEAIYLKMALQCDFDYVDEVVAVMRDHSYNTGKHVRMMYEDNLRYWTDFFKRPELPESLRQYRSVRLGAIHRTKGLQFIRTTGHRSLGRNALLQAIKTRPKYGLDLKVLAGLILSLTPDRTICES
jgi:glycosyltransferase involved in cell wall biosynthesis